VLSAGGSKLNVIFSYIHQHYKTRQCRHLLEVQIRINYCMLHTQIFIDFVTFKPTILATILSEIFCAKIKSL